MSGACSALATGWPGIAVLPGSAHSPPGEKINKSRTSPFPKLVLKQDRKISLWLHFVLRHTYSWTVIFSLARNDRNAFQNGLNLSSYQLNGQLVEACRNYQNGWMTCDFMSFSTIFQSYQDDEWMIMKGCVHWNPGYHWKDPRTRDCFNIKPALNLLSYRCSSIMRITIGTP